MTEPAPKALQIVVLDGYTLDPGDNPWDGLARLGELAVHDRTSPEELIERAAGADVLVVNKVKLSAADLARLPRLRFVAVSATGYNNVDVAAARERGIPVANVPEYGTDAVAQFAFALLLELCHRVGDHDASVKRGEWAACPDWTYWRHPLVELAGKRIGIVGFGRIGRRVGEIAHAFGMEVLAYDSYHGTDPTYRPFAWRELEEIFAAADVVTLHCPLTPETRRLVALPRLERMKPSAFLINAARGELVDEAALAQALDAGLLAGAALDVVSREPIRPDNPLLRARNCLLTPHIAWAALGSRQRLLATTVANVAAHLAGEPRNVVNP
jgi:glycerate dehydrogenase